MPRRDRAEGGQGAQAIPGPSEGRRLTEPEAREAVAAAHRRLGELGLILGSAGNVSVRLDEGMLITPTGAGPESASVAAQIRTGFDAPAPGASSEWALHAAIYRDAPEARAIVHTHSDACTALACLRRGLPAFHYALAGFGGDIRCAPYVTFGTDALARAAAEAIRGRSACLLANHGMVVHAPSLPAAVLAAQMLEALARQYLLACSAGTVQLLTEAELEEARLRYATYGRAAPGRQ